MDDGSGITTIGHLRIQTRCSCRADKPVVPALRRAREQAKLIMCLNNVRQVDMACVTYIVENYDRFPLNPDQQGSITPCWWRNGGGNDLMADRTPYVQNLAVFVDPSIPHAKYIFVFSTPKPLVDV